MQYFSAIIVGPGPGSPDCPQDVGIIKSVWRLSNSYLVPVFGVCLGLQTLGLEFGGRLKKLNVVKHGQISKIEHTDSDIFESVGRVNAVRYHSLHVDAESASELEPLGWADDGAENGKVLMAVKHRSKPFWAVQYHPESICTDGGGIEVVANFWRLAQSWSSIHSRIAETWDPHLEAIVGPAWPNHPDIRSHPTLLVPSKVTTHALKLPGLELANICEALGVEQESADFIMLESAAQPGRFCIVGCLWESTQRIVYHVGDSYVQVRRHGRTNSAARGGVPERVQGGDRHRGRLGHCLLGFERDSCRSGFVRVGGRAATFERLVGLRPSGAPAPRRRGLGVDLARRAKCCRMLTMSPVSVLLCSGIAF